MVAGVPESLSGSTKTRAFQGSILGGAFGADSRLPSVVPRLELIPGDFASTEIGGAMELEVGILLSQVAGSRSGAPKFVLDLVAKTWATRLCDPSRWRGE